VGRTHYTAAFSTAEESARKAVRKYDIKNADLVAADKDGHVTGGKPLRISN
jgi:hypothetical protein